MRRRRDIAAAPGRSASETVTTINDLVRDTLAASAHVDLAEVDDALDIARPALLALVAGAHLDSDPAVLVAAVLHLSITTVSGDRALTFDENLAPVPGAATATTWTLYLPPADPLADLVKSTAAKHDRLSAGEPPEDATADASPASVVDLDALARRRA